MTVSDLREYVFSWDGDDNILEHALFCASGELATSLADELYVKPSYHTCNGSYRLCRQRLPLRDLVDFLGEVSGGGDVNFGDFLCVEIIDDRVFILAHRRFESTHLFEVDAKWINFNNITELLKAKLFGFQGESVLSPLSLTILSTLVADFKNVDNPQDYYKIVDLLHSWANQFEYHYRFIKDQLSKEPSFFYGSDLESV